MVLVMENLGPSFVYGFRNLGPLKLGGQSPSFLGFGSGPALGFILSINNFWYGDGGQLVAKHRGWEKLISIIDHTTTTYYYKSFKVSQHTYYILFLFPPFIHFLYNCTTTIRYIPTFLLQYNNPSIFISYYAFFPSAMSVSIHKKTACVVGASGYVGSLLCKLLLQRGYAVRATVRNKDNHEKITHLKNLHQVGDLQIFEADLTKDGSFRDAVDGSHFVFIVATPVDFNSNDPQRDMIEPAVKGTLNVLNSCVGSRTLKRVVLTSSASAVCFRKKGVEEDEEIVILDENNWTDTDQLFAEKPLTWGYAVSKTLAEKAGFKFAEEKGINLISIVPSLITGSSLTNQIPKSVTLATSLITGDEAGADVMKCMESLFGSVSLTHIEDVVRAHVFLAEEGEEDASGRFICNGFDISMPQLSSLFQQRYPQYSVLHRFENEDRRVKAVLSSKKLVERGFVFKYNVEEAFDESVQYLESKGVLYS